MTDVQQKVFEILKSTGKDIPCDIDSNLLDSSIIDSFDIADILGKIEETFSIEIDGEDIIPENLTSIKTFSLLVEKYINA